MPRRQKQAVSPAFPARMSRRFTYLWMQDGEPVRRFLDQPNPSLASTLAALAGQPVGSGEMLARGCAAALASWAAEVPHESEQDFGRSLEQGLEALERAHGWRGPVALLLDSVRGAFHAHEHGGHAAQRVEREARAWLSESNTEWNGEPLSAGARWPSLSALAQAAVAPLQSGDSLLVQGWTQGLEAALDLAQQRLSSLRILCCEGLPLMDGRALARRFAQHSNLQIELAYDACLSDLCIEADRVWIGTEALGAASLLARVGTRRLWAECEAEAIPLDILASASALLPGGELQGPRETPAQLLWVDAPDRVHLRTPWLEELPLAPRQRLCTDRGREEFAALATRALRLERAPRCVPDGEHDWIQPQAAPPQARAKSAQGFPLMTE